MSFFGETPAQLISDYQSTFTYTCTFLGAVSLLTWEYIVTFDREVHLVWGRKTTGATVLFLLNRYVMFVQFIIQLPFSFLISTSVRSSALQHSSSDFSVYQGCLVLNRVLAVFSIAPYFIWAAFSSLRAFAMSERNTPIALLVLLLSLVPTGYNIYDFSRDVPINLPPPIFCIPTFPSLSASFIDRLLLRRWTVATRICLIVADGLVIAVTWLRTYRFARTAARHHVRAGIIRLLLRDGTIYFVILLILNLLHIAVKITQQTNFITTFEEPLTSIMISRFLLNLREVDSAAPSSVGEDGGEAGDEEGMGTLRFVTSVVGPLGEPLDHSFVDDDVEEITEEVEEAQGS
ncbi:hypothetical protein A0H81_07320 [Grifola frondosa]|uniref:DUF6533 domain-containing protein n=1 Tax=Grifola frondosa TaxID=5627 RepID=A0A1C7MA31_GRIFR|nr:hypothetical protein A0H81_07320 [Grifola frondosa]